MKEINFLIGDKKYNSGNLLKRIEELEKKLKRLEKDFVLHKHN